MGLAVGDIVSMSFSGVCLGQRILLTHNLRVTTAASGSTTVQQDLTALAEYVDPAQPARIGEAYLACMPSNYTLSYVQTQALYPTRSAYWREVYGEVGTFDGPAATAPNLAGVITLGTALAGRRQIANKHVGPLSPDGYNAGLIGATQLAAFETFASYLRAIIAIPTSCTYTPIVYHRTGDGPAAKFDNVTRSTIQNTVRVMRRRTVGLGE